MKLIKALLLLISVLSAANAMAKSALVAGFEAQGVPAAALERSLQYLEQNNGQTVKSREGGKSVQIRNQFLVIIDYSQASTEKRFYLLDLQNGTVEKHLVAHGRNSGVRFSTKFANVANTKMTSLGMAVAGPSYVGRYGKSMRLYGVEKSTTQLEKRYVVLHGATYVTPEFIAEYGRLGRSWGCTSLEKSVVGPVIDKIKEGTVIYLYHPKLMEQAMKDPSRQRLVDPSIIDDRHVDLPGEEEDLQSRSN